MSRFVWVAVFVAALAAVGGAQAKVGPAGLDVCGASSCHHVEMSDGEHVFIGATTTVAPPAAPAPFYEVRRGGTNEHFFFWIPAAHRARFAEAPTAGSWYRPDAAAESVLRNAAEGLEPVSPAFVRVTVGGRVAQQPETYERLFRGRVTSAWSRWVDVAITTSVATPWSGEWADVAVSRRGRYLYFDGTVLRISGAVAQRARRGLPLR